MIMLNEEFLYEYAKDAIAELWWAHNQIWYSEEDENSVWFYNDNGQKPQIKHVLLKCLVVR